MKLERTKEERQERIEELKTKIETIKTKLEVSKKDLSNLKKALKAFNSLSHTDWYSRIKKDLKVSIEYEQKYVSELKWDLKYRTSDLSWELGYEKREELEIWAENYKKELAAKETVVEIKVDTDKYNKEMAEEAKANFEDSITDMGFCGSINDIEKEVE